jgi:type I restriction enzyme S subunit
VSSGEVAFRDINDTREKITDLGLGESNAKIYPPGTVLLAMIGQGKTRGQCAILQCAAATNQNVAGIHVTRTNHSPRYVYWWLYANYQKSRSTETGTAQPALSAERVKQIVIPLPERNQQDRIVSQLDELQIKVDAVKSLQAETGVELDAMLPAILDKAFKGDL